MTEFDFQQNYFELFELEPVFQIDLSQLSRHYRQLQQQVHPDRYAASDEREKRLAVQYSALINQAYETLKSPVERARYLLLQQGVECPLHNTTFSDPMFLMQQIELREQMEELRGAKDPEAALDAFSQSLREAQGVQSGQFEKSFLAADYPAASDAVAKMQFLYKLSLEAEQLESELLDY